MQHFSLATILTTALTIWSLTASVSTNAVSLSTMTDDLRFLSDDKLAGRAAFTPEIDLAADYIAQRFSTMGLQPLTGEKTFKQTFTIYQITPSEINCQLDGEIVDKDKVMILSSHVKLVWNNSTTRQIETISAEQDFRQRMAELNQQDNDLLVLANPAHAETFNRYRQHFAKGLTKFEKNTGPSAVIVMTDKSKISQFSIESQSTIKAQKLTNVVGVLPGQQAIDEKIIFSAHYDHIGNNPALSGDTIFNGADDDATGTTAVINLAEYFSRRKNNQRTLVFVAFTAEEIGGFGSQYFSSQIAPESITAMINIEMIGKPSKYGSGKLWMTGMDRSNLADLLNKNLGEAPIFADPYPDLNLFYRSDNATLARLGVPAHSFSSSQIDIDPHYHQVSDELETIDLESMHQVIVTLAKAVQGLVDGKESPNRVDTSEVKPRGKFY